MSAGAPDPLDRRSATLVACIFLVAVAALLGRSLLGQQVLLATDQMLVFAPWSAAMPTGFTGSAGAWGDTYDIWEPQRLLFFDALKDGQLALWNPFPSGGAPLAAEPSTGTFGAFQLTYLLAPHWYAPAVIKLAELAVSAGFTFLFLRAVGLSRIAGALGGAVYALNGFQLVWTGWPQTRVGALVPALFWAVERLGQARTARWVAITALVVGAMLLEGFPAVTLTAVGAAALYLGVRCLADGDDLRRLLRVGALAAVGVGVGAGLAAVQLLPFEQRLGSLELEREQTTSNHLEPAAVFTLFSPNVAGSPQEGPYYLVQNYVEALSYVGAAACVLAVAGLLGRRTGGERRGVRSYAGWASAVLLVLIFLGGPLLALVQSLPPFDTNRIARLRALLAFFLAVLAALGVEGLTKRARRPDPDVDADHPAEAAGGPVPPPWRRFLPRGVLAVVVAAVLAIGAVDLYQLARDHALGREMSGDLLVAGALLAATVGALALLWWRPRRAAPALVAVALIAVGQGFGLWSSYLPESRRDEWFVTTPMHEFLDENLDGDRVVPADTTLLAGSTTYYDIRTVTGHVFTQPTWMDLLEAVDPAAFADSPTDSTVHGTPEVARSPVLDRMAARYFATSQEAAVLGARTPPDLTATGAAPLPLDAGDTLQVPLRAQRLRGVELPLSEPATTSDPLARLVVTVRTTDGTVVGTGALRVRRALGGATVAVDAETATFDGPTDLVAAITFDADDGHAALAAGPDGSPTVGTVSGDDDLRLSFTDGGQLYERQRALPRVRWASTAEVVADPAERIERLRSGALPDDVVLLDRAPGNDGPEVEADDEDGGSSASDTQVALVDDDLDRQVVRVDAAEAGYLVVADAVQIGWEATIDGHPAELLPADHAMGAVAVPAGYHVIELSFRPDGLTLGRVVTVLSILAVVALLTAPALLRRRRAA